jgi:hypothetical protein
MNLVPSMTWQDYGRVLDTRIRGQHVNVVPRITCQFYDDVSCLGLG